MQSVHRECLSTALNLEMKDARAAQSSAVVQRASLDGTIRERDGGEKENKSFAQSQRRRSVPCDSWHCMQNERSGGSRGSAGRRSVLSAGNAFLNGS